MKDDGETIAKEVPRLSPSIAKILVNRSPKHAWQAHRLLGGGDGKESTDAQDTGKILEALVFGVPLDAFVMVDAKDWRTKVAQDAAANAIGQGKTPILSVKLKEFESAAKIIRNQIEDLGIVLTGGEYQKHVEWTDEVTGAECHGFLDYYLDGVIYDLKTTTDASPEKVTRQFVDIGADIQDAAYRDGIETMVPALVGRSRMLFLYAETSAPFVVHAYEADGMMKNLGRGKWDYAKDTWAHCLKNNYWPSYFTGIGQLSPKPWQMADFDIETR